MRRNTMDYVHLFGSIVMALIAWKILDDPFIHGLFSIISMFELMFVCLFGASVLVAIQACLHLLRAELRYHREQMALQHATTPDNTD